jgi:hypothetical protein
MAVTTVEGIGSTKKGLHACQDRLALAHGSQCGFCTPGIVMSMYSLLQNKKAPTPSQVEHAFDGNLCRCTGYRSILEAYKSFCPPEEAVVAAGGGDVGGGGAEEKPAPIWRPIVDAAKFIEYDPSADPAFPQEIFDQASAGPLETLTVQGDSMLWIRSVGLVSLSPVASPYCSNICSQSLF